MSEKFKVKIKGTPHSHRLPFFCPHCKRATGSIDDDYLLKIGICSVCFVMHVEERSKPNIDLSKYSPPNGLFEGMTQEEINNFFAVREK